MSDTVKWSGYEFIVYDAATTTWNDAAGVYIFTGLKNGTWQPYYIGQAKSFKERFSSHEKWDAARRLGATHVHAMVVSQAASRGTIETALILAFRPPLNDQLK
jgi:excinuclease UvrABC nuclease subunit